MYIRRGTGDMGTNRVNSIESKIRLPRSTYTADNYNDKQILLRGGCSGLAVVSHVRLDECVGGDCVMGRIEKGIFS